MCLNEGRRLISRQDIIIAKYVNSRTTGFSINYNVIHAQNITCEFCSLKYYTNVNKIVKHCMFWWSAFLNHGAVTRHKNCCWIVAYGPTCIGLYKTDILKISRFRKYCVKNQGEHFSIHWYKGFCLDNTTSFYIWFLVKHTYSASNLSTFITENDKFNLSLKRTRDSWASSLTWKPFKPINIFEQSNPNVN